MCFQSHMTIARNLGELGRAGDQLRAWMFGVLADEPAADVELAMIEALTNSIRHSLPCGVEPISISLEVTEADVVLEIADGSPSMPSLFEDCGQGKLDDATPDFGTVAEGGRGLSLIVLSMDQVGFVERDGRTLLQMVRHRKAACKPTDRT